MIKAQSGTQTARPSETMTVTGHASLSRRRGASGLNSTTWDGIDRKTKNALHSSDLGAQTETGVPAIVHEVMHSPGQPLDQQTRAFMEPRFGHDFSGVRVHADSSASEAANAVDALAFAAGHHIVFGEGQFAPATSSGRHVLAHELAHTIQSTGSIQPARIQRIPKEPTRTAQSDSAEQVAEKMAETVVDSSKAAESAHLVQLRQLLDQWNVPESEVISLFGKLSPAEVDAVATNSWFKEKAVGALDDDEMIDALNAMNLRGRLRREWTEAEGIPASDVKAQASFAMKVGAVTLNPDLWHRLAELCVRINDDRLAKGDIRLSEGARSPSTAHQWSTAYYIRQGKITTDRLKALPSGKDLDGNLWWMEGWSQADAIANAESIWAGAKAYEGYPPDDPRRLPNRPDTVLSEHCFGEAMDVKIPWRKGDGWHAEATNAVEKSRLDRPLRDEVWHFERKGR